MNTDTNLKTIWQHLAKISTLTFESTSQASDIGWSGQGRGQVTVETVDAAILLFHEQGQWQQNGGKQLAFSNVYRWTALSDVGHLRLEHLRFGSEHPVMLFDLQPIDSNTWKSITPHLCREDCYTAIMHAEAEELHLRWRIQGPGKDECIGYTYR